MMCDVEGQPVIIMCLLLSLLLLPRLLSSLGKLPKRRELIVTSSLHLFRLPAVKRGEEEKRQGGGNAYKPVCPRGGAWLTFALSDVLAAPAITPMPEWQTMNS